MKKYKFGQKSKYVKETSQADIELQHLESDRRAATGVDLNTLSFEMIDNKCIESENKNEDIGAGNTPKNSSDSPDEDIKDNVQTYAPCVTEESKHLVIDEGRRTTDDETMTSTVHTGLARDDKLDTELLSDVEETVAENDRSSSIDTEI